MSGASQHLDLERLARVIAMGGSGHDGEALAALRQADRSIRDAGMTWHDVLLPGRLMEALTAEAQQLRDELTMLRAAKAAETQRLHDALAAVRRRGRRTRQRRPVGIIILCCLAAMYIMSDVISGCAGGAVLVTSLPANIGTVGPPTTGASPSDTQRRPDEPPTSQDIGTDRRTVFSVNASLAYPPAQLRPFLSPVPIRPNMALARKPEALVKRRAGR